MKKLVTTLAMLVGLTLTSAHADNTINNVNPYMNVPAYCVDNTGTYHLLDEMGNHVAIDQNSRYEPWQYLDENGYDYEVIIKVD